MRIAIAGLVHETNTFSPFPTTYTDFGDFKGGPVLRGADVLAKTPPLFSLHGFADAARKAGDDPVPVYHSLAQSSGRLTRGCYERLLEELLGALRAAGPFDAVFLELHGAMVAEHIADADAETARRVRKLVGADVPIVTTLDLHGNTSAEFIEAVDGTVGYQTYPHTDMYATGARAHGLLRARVAAGAPLARGHVAVPFLMPIYLQSTDTEPGRTIYDRLRELEAECPPGTFLTVMMGFSPADVPHCHPSVFGFGPEAGPLEDALAGLERVILEAEHAFRVDLPDSVSAVQTALAAGDGGRTVLADVQDNPGGGSPSDSPQILETLRKLAVPRAVVGVVFDPQSAQAAHEAGVGATLRLGIGGKHLPGHEPFEAEAEVMGLHDGPFPLEGPMLAGGELDLGRMAHVRVGGISVVLSSRRSWYIERACFAAVGAVPEDYPLIVVKSTNHYRADFAGIADRVIEFAEPAGVPMDPTSVPYRHLRPGTRLYGHGPVFGGRR